MSSSSGSNVAQVSPTQLLVKELIEKVKSMSDKIEILTHQVSQVSYKIDILGEEVEEIEGGDEYDLEMQEPQTPKRAKYTPKYEKKQ